MNFQINVEMMLKVLPIIISVFSIMMAYRSNRRSKSSEKITNSVKANQLALEAWDILGGKPGTFSIKDCPEKSNLILAKRKIDEALLVNPESTNARLVLGTYYSLQKMYVEAIVVYEKILKEDVSNEIALYNIADVYANYSELKKAEEAYIRSIECAPTRYSSHHNLAHLYLLMNRYVDAREEFEVAISLRPESVDSHYDLALLHANRGYRDKSIDVLLRALENIAGEKERSLIYGLLAEQYAYLGKKQDAIYCVEAAVELDSNSDLAAALAGRIHFEEGRFDKAIAFFSTAKKLSTKNLQHAYNLSICYIKSNMLDSAIEELNFILRRDPFFPDAREKLKMVSEHVSPNKSSHSAS